MTEQNGRPAVLVIFGITGDLAQRKLLPALYHLMRDNLLHPDTQIIGVTRQKLTKNDVLAPLERYAASHARPSVAALRRFKRAFHLFQLDMAEQSGYKQLKTYLDTLETAGTPAPQRLYYLSIPPAVFDEVIGLMGRAGLHEPVKKRGPVPALLIEKPFGYDLNSAKALVKSLNRWFDESQVYRIDHYLAKEMAQNILDFRFYNPLFAAVWDRQHIRSVVISAHEKIGIEGRARFYEQTGALRDIIQSHLLQLMSLVAMERPKKQTPASLHRARLKLLESIMPVPAYTVRQRTVRGQYKGYRQEAGSKNSAIETYAALVLEVDSDRWRGVPFVLKTGKAMHEKRTSVQIDFGGNLLTIQLQPDERIDLDLVTKLPGHGHDRSHAELDFDYRRAYPGISSPEAYERVLLDAINQDQSLFAGSREVLASWRIIQPVLDEWAKTAKDLKIYPAGGKGPLSTVGLEALIRHI